VLLEGVCGWRLKGAAQAAARSRVTHLCRSTEGMLGMYWFSGEDRIATVLLDVNTMLLKTTC
jgi:hypothetical protein